MTMDRWSVHRLHKWAGLTAALWIFVLGFTGILIDHRDSWRWLWHGGISPVVIPEQVVKKSQHGHIRLYQVNPENIKQQVSGGLTGLWWRHADKQSWQKTGFAGLETSPMVYAVLFSRNHNLWIATSDGLWRSRDSGKTAYRVLFEGKWISSISLSQQGMLLTGVIDRTQVFHYNVRTKKLSYLDLKPVTTEQLPPSINLSRYTRDIHYGRGVFSIPLSLLWNDITAIAMMILPLTGFLFYWLPRKWRKDKKQKRHVSHPHKKNLMRWLFRFHAPVLGLVAVIPIIYLSLTGILLDHAKELRQWMNSVKVTQAWQTPVYQLQSWQGEIYGVAVTEGKVMLATRLGLFSGIDNGENWIREQTAVKQAFFAWHVRQFDNDIYVSGMGAPNMVKRDGEPWKIVKGVGHMPSDITLINGRSVWKSRHGLKMPGTEMTSGHNHSIDLPSVDYVPWFYVMDGLHSGMLISKHWKWVNDIIAILAIFLVVTGLLRWWRNKWI